MVLAFFDMRYCNVSVMCFSEKPLRSVVAFEYAGTFWNTSSRKMRVSSLHLYKSLKSCSRSRSNFAQKFGENLKFKDNRSVIDRTKSIRKVSVLIGFNGVYDSNSDAIFAQESNMEVDKLDDSDLLLRCKRFTSITLGSSPIVDLYDGTESWPKSRSIFAAKWLDPDNLCETWPSLYPSFPDLSSPLLVEKISPTVSSPPPPTTKADTDLDVMESSKTSEVQSQNNVAAVELFLDKPISCIPGLKRRQCVQMEECGLHMLRKLLHHFPCTYADLQNAQCGINDGQYIIFVGKILSSRGVRTSGPLSFLEVVVGCDSENELVSEDAKGDVGHQENKIIYLHLKKFFRGTRFTCQPFLRSLQAKHREGDYVCVSGKV